MKISSRNSSAWVDVGKLCLLPAVAGADEAHLWARVSAGALWASVLLWPAVLFPNFYIYWKISQDGALEAPPTGGASALFSMPSCGARSSGHWPDRAKNSN